MKRLAEIADGVARFWEPLEPLRRSRRLGPVLWQLPESFHRDDDLLAAALEELPSASHGPCGSTPAPGGNRNTYPTRKARGMGIIDKITGRAKKAAGDVAGDASLRRQGKREERKGEKREELDRAQERAEQKAEEVADLERKT